MMRTTDPAALAGRPIACTVCGRLFKDENGCNQHQRAKHAKVLARRPAPNLDMENSD